MKLNFNGKQSIVIGATTMLTLGVIFGVSEGVKKLKNRKAKKETAEEAEEPEETEEESE